MNASDELDYMYEEILCNEDVEENNEAFDNFDN
ncbi:hypothetical protein CLOBY_00370 [Clostridium saccharobutylicum]|nr:hypothetical protein CLOBY_00370 [Clostridium saccharobutylicum]NSB89316.1 hypothetical protein [Clostridium saccharobutylicum]NYC29694.1 hypothetical protein [Clostridium saccharobutylicum]OOM17319.1 hypothetical protein CLSAB_17440 [Clostridium saccharobutylicum]